MMPISQNTSLYNMNNICEVDFFSRNIYFSVPLCSLKTMKKVNLRSFSVLMFIVGDMVEGFPSLHRIGENQQSSDLALISFHSYFNALHSRSSPAFYCTSRESGDCLFTPVPATQNV